MEEIIVNKKRLDKDKRSVRNDTHSAYFTSQESGKQAKSIKVNKTVKIKMTGDASSQGDSQSASQSHPSQSHPSFKQIRSGGDKTPGGRDALLLAPGFYANFNKSLPSQPQKDY